MDLTLDGSSFYAQMARTRAQHLVTARLDMLLAAQPDQAAYDSLLAAVFAEGCDDDETDPLVWAHLLAALVTFAAAALRMGEISGDVEAGELLRRTAVFVEQTPNLSV